MRPKLLGSVLAATLAATPAAYAQTTVTVDANANQRTISPLVYGVHFGSAAQLSDLNATVNRYGGNSAGRYNWQHDADNRGSDFFFYNQRYGGAPAATMDDFVQVTKNGGAEPFLTMPMVGWVANKNGANQSFSVAACPGQTGSDGGQVGGDAGNGCVPGAIPGFDPCQPGGQRWLGPYPGGCDPLHAASVLADHVFQTGWVQHVRTTFGAPNAGGLKFWGFDNEPSIWHNVYWDVHPHGAHDTEMRQKMIDYGAMIKGVDATIQTLGPEEWGWDGYFYSGADLEATNLGTCSLYDPPNDCPDHATAGHGDYAAYLLREMKAYDDIPGNPRILDWFTLHYYPQSFYDSSVNGTSNAEQALRNQSTRELWDPNYTSLSFINDKVKLIPRMKQMVADNYPGTKIGVTEYNWGADNHINGGTAQADVLGIFGREGADMAIRWVVPDAGTPTYNAFKMYRNYDGLKSTFGDMSVSATSNANADDLSVFAARRMSDGAMTVMVIRKIASSTNVTVTLSNFTATGPAQRYELKAAPTTIQHLANVALVGNTVSATVPGQSITLFVVPGGAAPTMADLSITKTDGQAAATPTQPITYTIVASNAGPSTATGATVTDTVPASITGATWTCVGAGGGTCAASGSGSISQSVNLPSGGSVTFTLTGTVDGAAAGTISNTASIASPVGVPDPDGGNNSATDSDTVSSNANLGITKTDGQASAFPGGQVVYTIVVSNAGPATANGATVTDTLPSSIQGATWTCVGSGGGGTCTASGSGNISQTVNLPSGGSVTFTLTGTIKSSATGTVSNTATVAAPAWLTDPTPGNNTATDTDTLSAAQPAKDIQIGSTSSGTFGAVGPLIWYRYRVRAGRSYCVEADNGKTDTSQRDTYLAIYRPDAVTVIGQNDDIDFNEPTQPEEPAAHFLSRVCYIATASEDNLAAVSLTGVDPPGGYRLRVVDTTLFCPGLGPLFSGSGFESFILIKATTAVTHTATVTLTAASGATLGTQTGTVPPNGSYNLQVSAAPPTGFGLPGVTGGIWIAHDGPPGGVVANVTTINFGSGVSYDTPALPRVDFR